MLRCRDAARHPEIGPQASSADGKPNYLGPIIWAIFCIIFADPVLPDDGAASGRYRRQRLDAAHEPHRAGVDHVGERVRRFATMTSANATSGSGPPVPLAEQPPSSTR